MTTNLPSVTQLIRLSVAAYKKPRTSRIRLGHTGLFNPIIKNGADPWVIRHGNKYYYCFVNERQIIEIRATDNLSHLGIGSAKPVWQPPGTGASHDIWAPELHYLQGRWYIYFAADTGDNRSHRMYVLESASDDPEGQYTFKGKLSAKPDRWAIDGTVMMLNNQLYFIWSGWSRRDSHRQSLFIAAMKSPYALSGPRICISRPSLSWEGSINEGPEVLQHHSQTFIIYSANASWSDNYCLGQLQLIGDDPLDPQAWRKQPSPVFMQSKSVFGPGHASFVTSLNGQHNWIIYHAEQGRHMYWNRQIRAQQFTWKIDNTPNFGQPV